MNRKACVLCALPTLILGAPAGGQRAPEKSDQSPATLSGRVCYGRSYLVPGYSVYLFTWEQSSKIRASMRTTEKRIYSPDRDIIKETTATVEFFNEVDRLLGKIPSAGKVKTDRSGRYKFSDVVPGVRYLVVTEWVGEDGVDFGARPTPVLKGGQKLNLDLMITTTPWQMEESSCSKATIH